MKGSNQLQNPEGPARHLDVLHQKLSPNCRGQFLTCNYPCPNCPPKIPPTSTTKEGIFASFEITPVVRAIARQLRDQNCLAAVLSRDIKMSPLAHWSGLTSQEGFWPDCLWKYQVQAPFRENGFSKFLGGGGGGLKLAVHQNSLRPKKIKSASPPKNGASFFTYSWSSFACS